VFILSYAAELLGGSMCIEDCKILVKEDTNRYIIHHKGLFYLFGITTLENLIMNCNSISSYSSMDMPLYTPKDVDEWLSINEFIVISGGSYGADYD